MSIHTSSDYTRPSSGAAAVQYTISIIRTAADTGTLNYSGNFKHSCVCHWDPKDKIPAGTYFGCSATYMNNASGPRGKREGIFIPGVPKRSGIFIHYWTGSNLAAWSDGCTVVTDADMVKIWNDITPHDGRNITVTVEDRMPDKNDASNPFGPGKAALVGRNVTGCKIPGPNI